MTRRTRAKIARLARRIEALAIVLAATRLTWRVLRGEQDPRRSYSIYPHDRHIAPVGFGKRP